MSDPSESDVDLKRVTDVVNALAEHFDTVQVFVTRHEAGMRDGTVNVQVGAGNEYGAERRRDNHGE